VISLAEASFMLLGLAIATVWWPHACRFGAQVVPVWSLIFITACAAALTAGTIDFAALGGLGLLALACRASKHPMPGVALSATWLAGSLALLLALHAWPGFQALPIIEGWQASPDARPFTLRASFDKAAAGLFLLAFFARRTGSWREFGRLIVRIVPLAALIALTTLGLAWQSGFVRPDFKWPDFAWQFIVINLLFTCVAEETFFRALIQENLHRLCTARPSTEAVALIYCRTRRIEAALIAHLSVNIVHFTGFTYPGLAH
jgi:uncharacterized protein